ncbi:winged helix-turn-helix domain-containing protein [Streptomyces zagrosensis]|uniref:DNA-binding transcriptional ArsR family regulator n=1 Tax=Streptomyces zagrosensis TaxID=1042984 RepID=A0A7W9Q7W7_9ACTN|nr:winged helix-turn-helix domain-containing protein [Streptomyces zagrosensis]MBB5935239.1 DNA-binding transcriptional ArsR family regulator [Streptomyces zagrosensis]
MATEENPPEAPPPNPPAAASPKKAPRSVRQLDARSLRGLAHPLRIRLLELLRQNGSATASQLADRLGESSGATSYHLRQLASYGFVEEETGRGTARERWWKAMHEGIQVDDPETFLRHADPEVRGAVDLLLHEIASIHTSELSTWLGSLHTWPQEWRSRGNISDHTLWLTPELMSELDGRLREVIEEYQGQVPADADGAASVRLHLHAFPREGGQQRAARDHDEPKERDHDEPREEAT